jgi:hypothetical protein
MTDGGIWVHLLSIVIDDGGTTTGMMPIDGFPVIRPYHDRIVRMLDITTPSTNTSSPSWKEMIHDQPTLLPVLPTSD